MVSTVFAELHDTVVAAILREKRLKKWRRVEARIDRAQLSAIAKLCGELAI